MNQQLEQRLAAIEKYLFQTVPDRVDEAWVSSQAGMKGLQVLPENVDRINAPNLELLKRGGKRWRPLVLALAYEAAGGKGELGYKLTPLVELPHNGSLIIDDIEDKSDERRGGPAIHLIFGVDMAVNSGNYLYFLPTDLLENLDLPVERRWLLTKYYLRVMRRLHFGQGLDIQWHNNHQAIPAVGEYLQMCRFKTGSLSRLSAEIGTAAAGASEAVIDAMGSIWEDIGVGFQIMDDVYNLTTGNPGKIRGDDIIEGKKSLPVILHCQKAADQGKALLALFRQVAERDKAGQPALILQAIALMEASGSIEAAGRQAEDLLHDGLKRLENLLPASVQRDLMADMVQGFMASFAKKKG